MTYEPNTIIKFCEMAGHKRTLYGIILEQLNENCLTILDESEPTTYYQRFFAHNDPNNIEVLEKVDSVRKLPEDTPKQEYFKKFVKFYLKLGEKRKKEFIDIIHSEYLLRL